MTQSKTFLASLLAVLASAGPTSLPWGYVGQYAPENWSKMFPLCGGETQSGIDIITENTIFDHDYCKPMTSAEWTLPKTEVRTFQAKDYGNSIAFSPVKKDNDKNKYIALNQNTNAVGKFPNQFNYKLGVHEDYCFHSFHFHWGTVNEGGSEHNINGLRFPLEAHFVHYSCDYHNLSEALADKQKYDKYVLGVVGVLFEFGSEEHHNEAFESILNAKEKIGDTGEVIVEDFDVHALVPQLFEFYAYEGSLTTPPCLPVVRWHVLKETVKISPAQLKRFQSYIEQKRDTISKNYRPVQENKNIVYACLNHQHDDAHEEEDGAMKAFFLHYSFLFAFFLVLFSF